jgi:hypothetical protein
MATQFIFLSTIFILVVTGQFALGADGNKSVSPSNPSGAVTPEGVWINNLCRTSGPNNTFVIVPLEKCSPSGEISAEQKAAYGGLLKDNSIASCSSMEKNPPPGTVCVTSKGYEFKRYKNPSVEPAEMGWEDVGKGGLAKEKKDRMIWYDRIDSKEAEKLPDGEGLNWEKANDFCHNIMGEFLPKRSQFRIAESHGFTEAVHLDLGWYWMNSDPNSFTEKGISVQKAGWSKTNDVGGDISSNKRAICVSPSGAK